MNKFSSRSILKYIFILGALVVWPLLGASCGVRIKGSNPEGGVYKSTDQGNTWKQVVLVNQSNNKTVTIGGMSVRRLVVSPQDAKDIFAVSNNMGVYETKDGGEKWQPLYNGSVQALAPHPSARDILYLASGNKLLKTINAGTDWQTVYLETTPNTNLNDVAIDYKNPKVVYLVTSKGVLVRSDNDGVGWQQLYAFKQSIAQIYINPHDPKMLYAVQPNGVLWRSVDMGQNWTDATALLQEQLKTSARNFKALAFLPSPAEGLLYASQEGIFGTYNNGNNWGEIKLVTTKGAVNITSLAVSPKKTNDFFYTTPTALYKTIDGGKSWTTITLPIGLTPSSLLIDNQDPNTVYMGFSR